MNAKRLAEHLLLAWGEPFEGELNLRTQTETIARAHLELLEAIPTVEGLTQMIADWLVAWADEPSGTQSASRYPIPPWAESERLAERILDALAAGSAAAEAPDASRTGAETEDE